MFKKLLFPNAQDIAISEENKPVLGVLRQINQLSTIWDIFSRLPNTVVITNGTNSKPRHASDYKEILSEYTATHKFGVIGGASHLVNRFKQSNSHKEISLPDLGMVMVVARDNSKPSYIIKGNLLPYFVIFEHISNDPEKLDLSAKFMDLFATVVTLKVQSPDELQESDLVAAVDKLDNLMDMAVSKDSRYFYLLAIDNALKSHYQGIIDQLKK